MRKRLIGTSVPRGPSAWKARRPVWTRSLAAKLMSAIAECALSRTAETRRMMAGLRARRDMSVRYARPPHELHRERLLWLKFKAVLRALKLLHARELEEEAGHARHD